MNINRLLLITLLSMMLTSCSEEKKEAPAFERPLPVIAAEVTKQDVPVYIEAIGNVTAYTIVDIRPQVSGKLIDVRIDGGDDVKAGDVLYRIDPLPFKLALEREEAQFLKNQAELEFAKKKIERYSKISDRDYVSKLTIEEFDKSLKSLEAQITIDQANISAAKNNLSYCDICSPIDGRVNLETVDVGNVVSPSDQTPLATILQISPIEVYFSLAQKDFEQLQDLLADGKRQFKVILPGTQKEFEGLVTGFNGQMDLKTGTIQVRGLIDNKDKILWPGEFVTARVYIKTLHDAAVVPSAAVQMGQQGSYVYVLKDDNSVEKVAVTIGEQLDGFAAIEKGLTPGMKVITVGQLNLKSGAKVMVTNASKENESMDTETQTKVIGDL